jgi:hypothetical protein
MGKFFWDDLESKHKYHLSNWLSLAQKKEHGGLDIPDLRDLNLCLLAAWVQRYQGRRPCYGKLLLTRNTKLILLTFYAVRIEMDPLLERGVLGGLGS